LSYNNAALPGGEQVGAMSDVLAVIGGAIGLAILAFVIVSPDPLGTLIEWYKEYRVTRR
jgi:hypothetical protein